jgi:hypothetical protein
MHEDCPACPIVGYEACVLLCKVHDLYVKHKDVDVSNWAIHVDFREDGLGWSVDVRSTSMADIPKAFTKAFEE